METEWWTTFLKHFLKQPVFRKPFLKQKLRLDSLYFSQNTLVLSEPRGGEWGYNHLHSIFKTCVLHYLFITFLYTVNIHQVNKFL